MRERVIRKAWARADKIVSGEETKQQTANMAQAIVVKTIPDQLHIDSISESVVTVKFDTMDSNQLTDVILGRASGYKK